MRRTLQAASCVGGLLFSIALILGAPTTQTAPAGGATKGPWSDANVGTVIVTKETMKMGPRTIVTVRTSEVVGGDANSVQVKQTVEMNGRKGEPQNLSYAKSLSAQQLDAVMAQYGKKVGVKTIKVLGNDMECEEYLKEDIREIKTPPASGPQSFTHRTFLNRAVPGWIVRHETKGAGQDNVLELTEMKVK